MPRGIYCNPDASVTIHIDSSEWCPEEDLEFMGPEIWKETMDYLLDKIEERWPSLYRADRWASREEQVMLENRHAELLVYEYCGLTSLALVPKTDRYQEYPELAEHWCSQIAAGLQKLVDRLFPGQTLNRTSPYTMSVREAVTS